MYLTRGLLNPRSRQVGRDLRDPSDLHRTVMSLFPGDLGDAPRKQCGALHRVDFGNAGQALLVVQSALEPNLTRLPNGYFIEIDDLVARYPRVDRLRGDALAAGMTLRFRLKANVTRKIDTKSQGDSKSNGQRVPLRDDASRIAWLTRKASTSGFEVVPEELTLQPERQAKGQANRTFSGVRFDGLLRVVDVDAFRATLTSGLGPAKAFGFGLLSIMPAANAELYEPITSRAS